MTQSENDRLDRIEAILDRLVRDVESLRQETEKTNIAVETYQKASQQVVNLAFALLATATVSIVIPAILNSR